MSTIVVVSKPEEEELQRLNVRNWPIWEKEVSEFPWTYEEAETCYILEGEVTVRSQGETVSLSRPRSQTAFRTSPCPRPNQTKASTSRSKVDQTVSR
jgi:hypothetical protein